MFRRLFGSDTSPSGEKRALSVEQQNWIDSNEKEDLMHLQRIQKSWNKRDHYPTRRGVEQASRLAYNGKLTKVGFMNLNSDGLGFFPTRFDFMAELTQCVKERIIIDGDSNIGPDNLSTILRNARCRALWIAKVSWNASLTRLLVQSLDSVEVLVLGDDAEVDLDTLTSYSGTGSCRFIEFRDDDFYGLKLKKFAHDKGWKYGYADDLNCHLIARP